jgi:hypothetical protein
MERIGGMWLAHKLPVTALALYTAHCVFNFNAVAS